MVFLMALLIKKKRDPSSYVETNTEENKMSAAQTNTVTNSEMP
jgi:hypothetical protein